MSDSSIFSDLSSCCDKEDPLNWRWDAIKQQMIALVIFSGKNMTELESVLSQENAIKDMNSKTFNAIVYYLLGLINAEERDKHIRWPLLTAQDPTKFRKGVGKIVKNLKQEYAWANIQEVPDSHFISPRGTDVRILDFILGLTSVVIPLVLNDPTMFFMSDLSGITNEQLEIRQEVVSTLSKNEIQATKKNIFPQEHFSNVKRSMQEKLVNLKKENDKLQSELQCLKKHVVAKKLVSNTSKDIVNELQGACARELEEARSVGVELETAASTVAGVSSRVRALRCPITLTAADFGLADGETLRQATNAAVNELNETMEVLKQSQDTVQTKTEMLDKASELRAALHLERSSRLEFLETFEHEKTKGQ